MNVRGVKARVRSAGGEVTDVGYDDGGLRDDRSTVAHVEAYFESHDELPEFNAMEFCDRVTVDREWDPEHNGVMFEVAL